jgi:hypothetical protein
MADIPQFQDGPQDLRNHLNMLTDRVNVLCKPRGDECFIAVSFSEYTGGMLVTLNIDQVVARMPKPGGGGQGLPNGGAQGQGIFKATDADGDYEWMWPAAGPPTS